MTSIALIQKWHLDSVESSGSTFGSLCAVRIGCIDEGFCGSERQSLNSSPTTPLTS